MNRQPVDRRSAGWLDYGPLAERPLPVRTDPGYDDHTPRGIGRDDLVQAIRQLPAAILVVLAVIGAWSLLFALLAPETGP